MAEYACSDCGYRGHYSEFKAHMSGEDRDAEVEAQDSAYRAGEDDIDDSVECPECGSDSAYET